MKIVREKSGRGPGRLPTRSFEAPRAGWVRPSTVQSLLLAALLTAAAPPADAVSPAPGTIELAPVAGGLVTDTDEAVASGALVGGRAGIRLLPGISLELLAALSYTSYEGMDWRAARSDYGIFVELYRLSVVYEPPVSLLDGALVPFISGAGGVKLNLPTELDIGSREDVDFAFSWGGGMRYYLSERWGLRLDLRHSLVGPAAPYTHPGKVTSDLDIDMFNNFEATLGAFFYLGGVDDEDGDGIADEVDECPAEPEDRDGFEDRDGCPDPDNDGDGVRDSEDGCPGQVGSAENAGCPEYDADGDGTGDKVDHCPKEAGPPENYGCPDTDQDGDGVVDRLDKCLSEPGQAEGEGCPMEDLDGDGMVGAPDQCPRQAEDKDEFEDEDGCPDPDNDQDGFPDVKDRCPNEPETVNASRDRDGCPDEGESKVRLTKERIELLDRVEFDENGAKVEKRSREVLEHLASLLRIRSGLTKVRIECHTAHPFNEKFNQRLSQMRAEAVRIFLVRNKVSARRLEAVGYGKSSPVQEGDSPEAMAANARVEVVILEVDGEPLHPPAEEGFTFGTPPEGEQSSFTFEPAEGAESGEQPSFTFEPADAPAEQGGDAAQPTFTFEAAEPETQDGEAAAAPAEADQPAAPAD